jgi:DNA-3-methyladenine glycosylase II
MMKVSQDFIDELTRAERHLARRDPVLRPIVRRIGACALRPHNRHFEILLRSIISQQLSTKVALTIGQRLKQLNSPARFPNAKEILAAEHAALRAAGLSNQKVSYMKDLAEKTASGAVDLRKFKRQSDHEVIEALIAIKGIGVWTAHMFLMFALGRLNILPVGDFGLRKAVGQLYGFEKLPVAADIEAIARDNRWHPYCSVASWYLWRSLG